MKRLTLMRHGDAQWKDPDTPDFARPLNKRGVAEAEAMARRLAELELIPALVVASPARRTQQCAEILARELALKARRIRYEEGLYLAPAEEMLGLLRRIGPRIAHVLLLGHNPGVSELARRLAPEAGLEDLSTGGICSLTLEARTWSGIGPEKVRDVKIESPPSGLFRLFA